MQPNDLDRIARQIRLRDLQAVYEAGAGHIGGEMSATDILTALYFRLAASGRMTRKPGPRPIRAVQGHVALALYVTLAKRGFIPEAEIATFLKPHSRLNGTELQQGAGRRNQYRAAGPRAASRGRHGQGRQADRRRLPHLCDDRRRRDAGGLELGGHRLGRAIQAGQPDADH